VKGNGSSLQFVQILIPQVETYNVNRGLGFQKGGQIGFLACAVRSCSSRSIITSFLGEKIQISGKGAKQNKTSWICLATFSPQ